MSKSYSSLLSWFGLTLAASLMLYHTSDRVTALNRQLNGINAQIESEQQSLHILKAEWVYLANPARVSAEVKRHLALQATDPHHVVAMAPTVMADLAPLRNGVNLSPQKQLAVAQIQDVPTVVSGPPAEAPAPIIITSPKNRIVSSINAGHINDHVVMQHTALVPAGPDHIGALIHSLSLRP